MRVGPSRGLAAFRYLSIVLGLTLSGCGASTPSANSPAGGTAGESSDEGAKLGTTAPDFAARDLDGKTLRLSDYLGKSVVLLDFWWTGCQPCLAEMPHLRRIYEANRAKGLVIVGVSIDGPETVADVPAFVSRNNLTFPIVLDEDSHIASLYNPKKTAPLTVLIDRKGKVVRVHDGFNAGDEVALSEAIAKVLDPGASPQ